MISLPAILTSQIPLAESLSGKFTLTPYYAYYGSVVFAISPLAGPIDAIRLALAANQQYAERPQVLRHLMKSMLETFVRKSDKLRKAKPTVNAVTHS